jgi:hypothetical protein
MLRYAVSNTLYVGFAEKVVCEERELLTLNWEQFQLSGYGYFSVGSGFVAIFYFYRVI